MESENRIDVAELTKVLTEQVLPVWKKLAEEISSVLIEVFKEFSQLILDLHKEGDAMVTTRQAILRVSRPLLEALLPDFRTVALLRYGELVEPRLGPSTDVAAQVATIAAPFHQVLKLPADCRITGIAMHPSLYFDRDEVTFRIESPDFMETPEGGMLPEVQAMYSNVPSIDDKDCAEMHFFKWEGTAVETRRIYGPDGVEVQPPSDIESVAHHGVFKGVPAIITDAVSTCWRCSSPTTRRLPGGAAECQDCAEKPLL